MNPMDPTNALRKSFNADGTPRIECWDFSPSHGSQIYELENKTPAAGQIGGLSESPCSAIPAIQSASLNIGTAARDADNALECWDEEKWEDSVMWIDNAIAQLESARAKITAHASSPNASREGRRGEDAENQE